METPCIEDKRIGTVADGRLLLSHDRRIPFRTRFSERARRMRLTLSAGGELSLILPLGTPSSVSDDFLRSSLPWIERNLLKIDAKPYQELRTPPCFPAEFVFPAVNERFQIRYEWRNVCWIGVREEGDSILAAGAVLNPVLLRDALRNYLIRKAERVFAPMLKAAAETYGFHAGRISFRFQRGRWGSCSRAGDISLNAQLLFLRPEEVRYVMIHELCHTREMNHSKRFWNEVGRYCPGYARIRSNLKRTGPRLWQ